MNGAQPVTTCKQNTYNNCPIPKSKTVVQAPPGASGGASSAEGECKVVGSTTGLKPAEPKSQCANVGKDVYHCVKLEANVCGRKTVESSGYKDIPGVGCCKKMESCTEGKPLNKEYTSSIAGKGFAELGAKTGGDKDIADLIAQTSAANKQNPAFSDRLGSAFNDEVKEQEQKVRAAEVERQQAVCLECSIEQADAAKKKLEEEQKKLDEMKAMQNRLAAAQKGEASATPRPGADCPGPGCKEVPDPAGVRPPPGSSQPPPGSGNRPASTFPPQQQQQNQNQNPYQQCNPQYFCTNNARYWGSPQQQQQQQPQYNYSSGSYTYPQQCQNQFVQACQYGCAQPQGTAYSTDCAPNPQQNATAPVASLSCGGENTLFDVGMSVPITFSCTNSQSSTGSGFSTNGVVPTGTAAVIVQKPPAGADTVSYGLTCTASNNQTASKRCDVKINVTSIIMIANPRQIATSATSTLGWVTRGMKTCIISSPDAPTGSALERFNQDNAEIKNASGVAITPRLTADTTFKLSCVTKADQPKSSTITVKVGS